MAVPHTRPATSSAAHAEGSTVPPAAARGKGSHPDTRLLLALFFLSGASGLIYQVVWFRKLALIFGVTSYALGIVLAAFMGGLALGALIGGRLAERTTHHVRAYALLEIAIGAFGLLVLQTLDVVQVLYIALQPAFAARPEALAVLRFGLSLLVLLPSTVCMGATLPLLARATGSASGSAKVSSLYSANTAGAVFGTLLAGLVLIGLAGMQAATVVAAAINIGAGAYLLVAWRAPTPETPSVRTPTPSTDDRADEDSAKAAPLAVQRAAVLAFTVAGLTGLAYEVVWTRLAGVLVFGLVYGFTAILAVLLTGIALGSALFSRWPTRRLAPVWQLAWLQVAIGALVASAPLWLAGLADDGVAATLSGPLLEELASHNLDCSSCTTVLAGLLALVFTSSVLFGWAFPAAVRTIADGGPGWASRFGSAYALNVIGAVAGSLVAGFVLLPLLGAHGSMLLLASLNVAAAIVLALAAGQPRAGLVMLLLGGIPIGVSLTASGTFDVYRTVLTSRISPDADVVWYREGLESSVAVTREIHPQAETTEPVTRLLINGDYHSSTAPSELGYHRLLGHLGPLLHSQPGDVLVVGLAGGATAGTIALYPDVRLHVVELSDAVFGAAEHYAAFNYNVLSSPRATFQNDDGRNHLLVSGRQYDLIQADLLYPRHVGSGVIYSREYFELVRKSLKPRGLAIQWLASNPWALRTFTSVFPYVTYWAGAAVGSNEPQSLPDPARFARLQADPSMSAALHEVGLRDYQSLLALGSAESPIPVRRGPLLTDDRPAIEYFLTLPVLAYLTEER